MKKKKSMFNSKIFLTITLLSVLCCFMATSLWAARKVEFYKSNSNQFINQINQRGSFESVSIGSVFGLTQDEELMLLRQRTDFNRVTHYRYQQTYKGIPIWGMHTILSVGPSDQVIRLHGTMALDIPKDIKNIPSSLDPKGASKKMKNKHKEKNKKAKWNFRNEKYGTYIYVDKKEKAHLCYVVSFFADNEYGEPSHFIHIINAKSGKVLRSFDSLKYAEGTGPGGNQKVGYYYYGTDYPGFCVSVNGSTCTMNCTDVKTVDLNHGTSGSTAYSYTCYENTHKEINGAYCPLNDAQYFGQVTFDTYMDWYGVPVLPFQLTLRCHYSTNYENAFWDGSTMTFGDGYTTFYPLVCIDVVAHEVSHGFTDYHSDLTYSGQSGGINESFSDMAGEAAEYYMRGTNDFMCGYDIYKAAGQALRYLYDPPLDGVSIDHVDDYYSGMDVHYSSGIYNKVFYLIATSPGWNTRMSFDIFVKCNMDYWQPSTNFQQGAEAAIDAAMDYGYNCQHVADAFAAVGITVTCPGPPVADFSGSPTTGGAPLTVNFTDLSVGATSWSWDFGDTGTSTDKDPVHTYNSSGTYTVSLTATNASGSDTETKTNYITVTAPQPPVADFVASSTNISVGDSINFTDQSTNTPTSWSWTFEGGSPGSSTSQNPTNITYNTAGTFDVTLTATNAQGSDIETKVDYITVTLQPYCTSSGNNQNYEYIAGVQVADLNNSSGASGYSDFTGMIAYVTQDETISVSLTPGFPGSSYTEYWKIWIDYNGDQDFEDAGEEVFAGSGSSVVNGNFTVPTSTLTGNTRMRVSMSYSTYPPICGTFTYGEVEDYTVNITAACTQYTLTTNTVGQGSITLDPPGGTYCEGTVVTLTATPAAGWQFDNWSGDLSGTTNPTTITMSSNKSVTANFSQLPVPDYTLTVNTVGQGSVTLDPPGGTYPEGTVVTLTATPDSGWKFDNWSGDLTGTANPDTITMDADKTVTANFSEIGNCTEIVGNTTVFGSTSTSANRRAMPFTMPENGEICSVTMYHAGGSGGLILGVYDGEGTPQNRLGVTPSTTINSSAGWQTIDLTSPAYVSGGSTVWLAWVYQSNPGIRYQTGSPGRYQSSDTWSGGMPDPFGSGSQASYLYSIYANYTPTAPPQYTLTVNIVGQGSVDLNPPGGVYDAGTVVTLTATADSGWQFDNWSGDLSTSDNPTTITMNSNKTVTANFTEIGTTGTVGNTTVFGSTSTSAYRRAMPFTMPENGVITSVTMYHTGGSGDMILAVYDGESTPQARLAVTAETAVSGSTGWQTINLTSSAAVSAGETVWLAWVYQSNPGIRYQTGSPGRYQSSQTWSGGMPDPFGSGSQTSYIYSIYATYNK
jgi:Zn-dependent metalloprotease/PKD repeat protein